MGPRRLLRVGHGPGVYDENFRQKAGSKAKRGGERLRRSTGKKLLRVIKARGRPIERWCDGRQIRTSGPFEVVG